MKNLLFAVVGLLLMGGCSDKKTEAGETNNPYLPIADLVIPREAVAGADVTLQGVGFTEDCRIFVQLNGETTNTPTKTVSFDDKSLCFTLPSSIGMGFYVVVLRKDGKYHKIGGINVRVDNYLEEDFEVYALAGEKQEVYPVSVSKQLKGTAFANSSTLQGDYFGSVVALSDGKIYYCGFTVLINPIRYQYNVSFYDAKTQTNVTYGVIQGLCAIGNINNELYLLTTTDNKLYNLYKYEKGEQTFVKTFDMSPFGGKRLLENDMAFQYHAASGNILISGIIGEGTELAQANFALNFNTGVVTSNGDNGSYSYWFSVVEEKLYCFATEVIEEIPMTKAMLITNPARWNLTGEGATLLASIERTMFAKPAYSPITGLIYGMDDIEEPGAVLMFNTTNNRFESKKWVNPGVACLFYADPIVD